MINASLSQTQALRMVPGSLAYSLPLPWIARHLGPRQSRGPGESNGIDAVLAHGLVGGLRFSAKRPTATATRIAPGTTRTCNEEKK